MNRGFYSSPSQDRDIVKDLIQDLFIDLNAKKERLGDIKNIKFYLFKSLKRQITHLFKHRNLAKYPTILQSTSAFGISVSHEQYLIDQEVNEAKREALEKAYMSLSARQREVLLYYFYEGLNYEEITELMDFSKSEHARKLVYRSVGKLRQELLKSGGVVLCFSFLALLMFYIIDLIIR